jgi:hypothetical protein
VGFIEIDKEFEALIPQVLLGVTTILPEFEPNVTLMELVF